MGCLVHARAVLRCKYTGDVFGLPNAGIQVLLPLFSQLKDVQARTADENLFEKEAGLLISTLLSLICALITNHSGVQEQTMNIKGFLLVGFLLEQVHPFQLDVAVVNVLLETAAALSKSNGGCTVFSVGSAGRLWVEH